MVRTLKVLIWTMAIVALWASAEQGAFVTPPAASVITSASAEPPAVPQGSWEKLKNLFSPPAVATSAGTSRKGSP